MGKILFLFLILGVGFYRFIYANFKNKDKEFLLISLFIQTIPFGLGKAIVTYLESSSTVLGSQETIRLGAFGNSIFIELSLVFAIFFVLIGRNKINITTLRIDKNKWFYIFLVALVVSFVNPNNIFPQAVFPLASLIIQLFILLIIIKSNYNSEIILKGIFDGLIFATIFQFILVICYPVLGLESIASLFRGESAIDWSNRREGYPSAIGTFGHPSQLALFSLICTVFFLSTWLKDYKKRLSFYFIIINITIIILTFSRTTYIACIGVITLTYAIHQQDRGIFNARNIIKFTTFSLLLLIILYASPLSDMFLESDAEKQIENRIAHITLGYNIWLDSKVIGIGINSHVLYMGQELLANVDSNIIEFLTSSPIHNIHFIVLAELGLIGFVFWIYFFISRISRLSKNTTTAYKEINIFNLTYLGIIAAIFVYGLFGWAPFAKEMITLSITLGYFAVTNRKELSKIK